MNKIIKSLILIMSIFTLSLLINEKTNAKETTKIHTIKKYKSPKKFIKLNDDKEYIWNNNHSKQNMSISKVPKKTLYATKLVSMHFPKYQYNVKYYYVQSKDKKIHGFIWKGAVIPGEYIQNGNASYFKYLKTNIIASTTKLNFNFYDSYSSAQMPKQNNYTINKFAKTPTTDDINRVVSFFFKDNNVKINMMNAYGTEENSAKFPFLQLGNKKKNNPIYINEMNFWTALELSKINGKVKKDYQKDPKNRCVVSDGISFYFPSDGSNNRLIENGVNKIYQSGYGENNDLTLVQTEQGYLRFVRTNALLTLPKNGFKLVNNIWIGTDYTEKKLNKLDSNISKTYRQFYSYGFTQYHYINNKWTKQFEISYKKSKNNLKIQKIVDDKTKTIDNKNILSDLTEYLYKPANYFS